MISVPEAEHILKKFNFEKTEKISLFDAYGRILAKDIVSKSNIPEFRKSNMDGYAVTAPFLEHYTVIDEVHAGDLRNVNIEKNQCVFVATGGKVPKNAYCIIPIENTKLEGNIITVFDIPESTYIVEKGSDIVSGQLVLEKGSTINERNVGLLASLGISELKVYKIPKVAIISTGDELEKISDVNSKTIAGIVRKAGGIPVFLGVSKDDRAELRNKILEGLNYDIIVTSGGVSVGKRDYTPDVVNELGTVLFHGVKMRPGKPVLAGEIDGIPIICTPGKVTSCIICSYLFIYPLICRYSHSKNCKKIVSAKILGEFKKEVDKRFYVPVIYQNGFVNPVFKDSSHITSIAYSNGIVELKEGIEIAEGDVEVWLYD
ncbi:molybdenum cofactor synthesis domain [Methanococcus vannielii SB]|uniref:Molybdenum cofactor synthesis domain n=1 Tax=Methanococcus vannielii (strain ATCC 35089 / DSM 1224 / JCM 13029 / OCM 148 / SB) TaxID=406327 RepID=A6UST5_METVS|nr:molybdopterin molybdotransferase MoeA [Methanococcus vannielii]ABR55557.1 molybdenum cofactor synthesis domain [Methanococcus vannielii SB]